MLTNGFQYIITCQLVQELIECSILADWIYHNTKHHYDQQHLCIPPPPLSDAVRPTDKKTPPPYTRFRATTTQTWIGVTA